MLVLTVRHGLLSSEGGEGGGVGGGGGEGGGVGGRGGTNMSGKRQF